jgi:hypothetical protein
VGIIAQEERGDQVRAAAQGAQGEMSAARADHQAQTEEAHAQAQADIDAAVRENAGEQRGVRGEARARVREQRREWSEAQQEAVDDAHSQADTAGREGARTIGEAARRGRREAAQQVAEGNRRVETARQEAEGKAERERRRGEQEGSGFFGWLASKAKRFFNSIKEGIQRAFAAARQAGAIENAQRWDAEKIEQARKAIVDGIRWVGDRMIAIGDVLLAGFPTLRDRYRSAIEAGVKWGEDRVNELAADLQAGVKRFLDGLGAALNGLLNVLEAGLLAAVDAVAAAVQGAIQFARSVADGLAQFAALVRDVASDPGGWLRNLGAAVVDGVRNHLWTALKAAVKEWFNSKVEAVVGLGTAVWGLLTQGGISLAAVGKMVWGGLKAAIPPALIAILVEKLVAMVVPAIGAVMAIVEGAMAAWGAVSRIIAAFSAFFAFLRAVRGGSAGPLFATAVAAGAVAVIDFAANFLIARLRRPAGALAGRIRALAQRIGARLKRVLGRRRRRGGRRRAGARRRRRPETRAGARRRAGGRRRPAGRRRPTRRPRTPEQRRQRRDQRRRDQERRRRDDRQARLDRAVAVIEPGVRAMFSRGSTGLLLRARLLYWKTRYRLSELRLVRDSGEEVSFVARINPWVKRRGGLMPEGEVLRLLIHRVSERLLTHPTVVAAAGVMDTQRTAGGPVQLQPGVGFPAAVAHMRGATGRKPPGPGQRHQWEVGQRPLTVEETRGWQPDDLNRHVLGGGAYTPAKAAGMPTSILGQIRGIRAATGLSDVDVAAGMRQFVRFGTVPRGLVGHRQEIATMAFLVFGREGGRSPGSLAFAAMTVDEMGEGRLTARQAFNRSGRALASTDANKVLSGGRFPMSLRGAQGAAAELEAERTRGWAFPNHRSPVAAEMARREIRLAAQWLRREMAAEGLRAFRNRQHAHDFVHDRLLAFYRI